MHLLDHHLSCFLTFHSRVFAIIFYVVFPDYCIAAVYV